MLCAPLFNLLQPKPAPGLRAWLLAGLAFGLAASACRAEYGVYPAGALNPRVPCIAPERDEAGKFKVPFDVEFTYPLAPGVRFAHVGRFTVLFSDAPSRAEKQVLRLEDGPLTLSIIITPASEGQAMRARLSDGKLPATTIDLKRPREGAIRLQATWDRSTLKMLQDGVVAGEIALPRPFHPASIMVRTGLVASLEAQGEGRLSLNWSDGYRAHIQPAGETGAAAISVLGFDARVISLNRNRRDCPYVQVVNAGPAALTTQLRYELSGEVTGLRETWRQTIVTPAQGESLEAIALPSPLATDVYHLRIRSEDGAYEEQRHFLLVQRREEPAGPLKFGLHDSGAKQFGYWPDALPIDVAHVYASWAYIQGPPWIRDFKGDWGIDPNLPAAEWNWNPRLDWMIHEGRKPYVCLIGTPFQDWQRGKRYTESHMKQYGWGWRGGTPDDAKYRRFLRELIGRYRGKVWAYEVENEPNTPHGYEPADYATIARAVYEEVKAADPQVRVFGICGTSLFANWMRSVFDAGGAQWLDGVSWHTYVTPSTPEEANLAGLLGDARSVIAKAKPGLAMINSETGTYVAVREQPENPIPPQRLVQLIKDGVQPLVVPRGWPSRAMSERDGASSLVANAVTNFLAGAECFVFFGWNLDWPKTAKWWNTPFDDSNFGMFSVSREGVRTPSQFTLAAAVLTAQLEPADHQHGREVRDYGLRGAIFPKQGGGEVAVLWSATGRQTVQLESASAEIETVTLLGQAQTCKGTPDGNRVIHTLQLGAEPLYVHSRRVLRVLPGVVSDATAQPSPQGTLVRLTLRNPLATPWQGELTAVSSDSWLAPDQPRMFIVPSDGQVTLAIPLLPARNARPGPAELELRFVYPDGAPGIASVMAPVPASFGISQLPPGLSLADMRAWTPGDILSLHRPEQVAIGRPPATVSLQEKQYWGGEDELSAKVKVGSDATALSVYVAVHDTHAAVPKSWPGVGGSCIELFVDARSPAQGLGSPRYDRNVHQLVIRPALQAGKLPAVWAASGATAVFPNQTVEGGRLDASNYWVAIRIPWKDLGMSPSPRQPIGLDVAVNGAKEDASGRKTQMVLFGTAANNRDASRFGVGFLP